MYTFTLGRFIYVLFPGAISLAIEDVTRLKILPADHQIDMVVAETYGEEMESILQTAKLWTKNVSVRIAQSSRFSSASWFRNTFLLLGLHRASGDVRSRSENGLCFSSTHDLLRNIIQCPFFCCILSFFFYKNNSFALTMKHLIKNCSRLLPELVHRIHKSRNQWHPSSNISAGTKSPSSTRALMTLSTQRYVSLFVYVAY